ncbi:tripartite tricarboxylate transporter TctB family protein [Oceanobacillus kimchii]|uniref:tripartite tricarboxylate transporter TctB family protein n=1 Tax=Oceanobacillus kimchii TaxID=746691 RepID=UPI0009867AB6|nr:tripartite tricarboxylate transporter TctB family protein [Oceanobacillus kimchii]
MHENKLVDLYSALLLIVLSIVLYTSTLSFKQISASKIGSDFLPQVVAIALFILSGILFVSALTKWRKEKKLKEEVTGKQKEVKEKLDYTLVLISLVLIAVYLVLIPVLGFLLSTAGYLFIQIYLISTPEKRSPIKFAIVSIIVSVSVYWVFKNVFFLMLPAGILG